MRGGYRAFAGRPAFRPCESGYRSVDIRRLSREGILGRTASWRWQWRDEDGDEVASINLDVTAASITFRYRETVRGEAGNIRVLVTVERTPCNYGNTRPWFRCPNCQRRCTRLFMVSGGLGCQRCLHMAYYSQREDPIGRAWRRQSKIERRLGDNLSRPKGMHRRTAARLVDAYWREEMHKDELFCVAAARLVGLW